MGKKKNKDRKEKARKDRQKNKQTVIEAAGAVIFRPTASRTSTDTVEGLEILLEHRGKYDDWSIPKGKLDGHESLAHTAVREVGEETGVRIRLSAKLGEVTYPLHLDGSEGQRSRKHKGGKHGHGQLIKHVTYWAGVPISDAQEKEREEPFGHANTVDKEVDHLQWLSWADARAKLTYPDDHAILDSFRSFVEAGGDHAATLLFLRHGTAEKREKWAWGEAARPITPQGAAEAFALTREIACYAPSRLFSSPWRRCLQTIAAYAAGASTDIEPLPQMTEDEAESNPQVTVAELEKLMGSLADEAATDPSKACAALCLHRPVLGLLLPLVADMASGINGDDTDERRIAKEVPGTSPWLEPGTGLAVTLTRHLGRLTILDAHPLKPVLY